MPTKCSDIIGHFNDDFDMLLRPVSRWKLTIGSAAVNKDRHQPKHPLKVHVWAGISRSGATGICIFEGRV